MQKTDYLKLHDILEEKLGQLNMVKGELATIHDWSRRRMARLRWHHAVAQISTMRAMGHMDIPKPDPFALETPRESPKDLMGQVGPRSARSTVDVTSHNLMRTTSAAVCCIDHFVKICRLRLHPCRLLANFHGSNAKSQLLCPVLMCSRRDDTTSVMRRSLIVQPPDQS